MENINIWVFCCGGGQITYLSHCRSQIPQTYTSPLDFIKIVHLIGFLPQTDSILCQVNL